MEKARLLLDGGEVAEDPEAADAGLGTNKCAQGQGRWGIATAAASVVVLVALGGAAIVLGKRTNGPRIMPQAGGVSSQQGGISSLATSTEAAGAAAPDLPSPPHGLSLRSASSEEASKLSLTASHEYGIIWPPESICSGVRLGEDYPWLQDRLVLEPLRPTTLQLGQLPTNGRLASWEVTSEESNQVVWSSQSSPTAPATISLQTPGKFLLSVVVLDSTGRTVATLRQKVACLYVKRELRSLTEQDREAFLDTALTLWTTTTTEGRALYGAHFTGMDMLVQVHGYEASGDVYCDHWHEGSGFLTHHLALAQAFDAGLISVNPAVITPYWDFTIDGEKISIAGGGPSMLEDITDLFTDKWFGSSDENSLVVDGRWAHMPAYMVADSVTPTATRNSFGIIRAPWNNNPELELARHKFDVCGYEPTNKPIPSCATHFSLANMTTFSDFQLNSAGSGHGPMHVNTGGVYGECTKALAEFETKWETVLRTTTTLSELDDRIQEMFGTEEHWQSSEPFTYGDLFETVFVLEYFHVYRMLYRSQTCALDGQPFALQCPENCDAGDSTADCRCTCNGVDAEDFDWENLEPCLYASNRSKFMFQATMPPQFRKDLVKLMCSTQVMEGEQLESTSPLDIVFWMIHPVIDRLLAAKRLADVSQISFGAYGPVQGFKDAAWLDYSFYNNKGGKGYYCEGHSEDAEVLAGLPILPSVEEAADTDNDGVLTNMEFLVATDPKRDDQIYIYDHFHWDHCSLDNARGQELAKLISMFSDSDGSAPAGNNDFEVFSLLLLGSEKGRTARDSQTHSDETPQQGLR